MSCLGPINPPLHTDPQWWAVLGAIRRAELGVGRNLDANMHEALRLQLYALVLEERKTAKASFVRWLERRCARSSDSALLSGILQRVYQGLSKGDAAPVSPTLEPPKN